MVSNRNVAVFMLWTTCALTPFGAFAQEGSNNLLNMSLEQLSDIAVTSVSKKSEKASQAPAAISVITQEDIRRSGFTSIPEALRMVPGLQVAQAGASQWAITARGFNDQFANKLLVLIDGRTVYTPLFSGVYWDVQDVVMEDIERIEVIRGPGATLWGANAVNGVINIITKNAKDTVGGLVSAGGGNNDQAFGSGRYGGKIGENVFYRGYVKRNKYDEARNLADEGARDAWDKTQGGFRVDWQRSEGEDVTVQGDVYHANEKNNLLLPQLAPPFAQNLYDDSNASGANILGRWHKKFSQESDISLQVYFDNTRRDDFYLGQTINTLDIDFQHAWTVHPRHEIVWGVGYRKIADDLDASVYLSYVPADRSDNLFSMFVQDKMTLLPDELFLTLGSKFEDNDYTGFEFQPSARISWLINDQQTLWASVAKAVRTPNRTSSDTSFNAAAIPSTPPGFARFVGNPDVDAEDLVAYEVGYRIQPASNISVDVATFYNNYDDLFSNERGTPFFETIPATLPPHIVFPIAPGNNSSGDSKGIEISANWEVTSDYKLAFGYSYIDFRLRNVDASGITFAGKTPEQQFNVRSYWSLPYNFEIDNAFYFMDGLAGADVQRYLRFDARLGWKPIEGVELSLVGQNLLDNQHPEFSPFIYKTPAQVGRSVYGQVTWRF